MLFHHRGQPSPSEPKLQPTADDDNAAGGRNWTCTQTSLPKYVVAIRGTVLKFPFDDLKANGHIVKETLHAEEHLYVAVENLIRKIVKERGSPSVWVAGHSLGATIGLIATRKLALEGEVLKARLFNPPFASSDVLFSKLVMSIGKDFNDAPILVHRSNGIKTGIEGVAVEYVRRPVGKVMGKIGEKVDWEYCEDMASQSKELLKSEWVPHLYVNPKDTIYSEYKTHFKKYVAPGGRHTRANSAPASISKVAPLMRKLPPAEAKDCN